MADMMHYLVQTCDCLMYLVQCPCSTFYWDCHYNPCIFIIIKILVAIVLQLNLG